jgi:pimeloyl-ACP methyl ester carboxylesterase
VAEEVLQIRVHGSPDLPTLIYLPGTHGDWSLIAGFRNRLLPEFRFVEFTYPRTADWSLADYAAHIRAALAANDIRHGWLLGESFGSQVAWLLAGVSPAGFKCQGIILAGGFGRHPFPWGVDLAREGFRKLIHDEAEVQRVMKSYARWVRWFYEATSERDASIHDFIQRRTHEDGLAAIHRLKLIRDNHPQALVGQLTIPVYSLSGVWDALVPWYLVTPWLKRHCPGYRESKLILSAEHNVLFSAPTKSARTIREWLGRVA